MTTPEFRLPEDELGPGRRHQRPSTRQPEAQPQETEHPTRPHRASRSVTSFDGGAVSSDDRLGFPLTPRQLEAHVRAAMHEDGAFDDVATIACVMSTRRAHATIVVHRPGVIAGIPLAIESFRLLDPNVAIRVDVEDGEYVSADTGIMRISGLARAVLSAERVALRYLQRLSGIATLTAHYAEALREAGTTLRDSRHATPGTRLLESYAARAGGAWVDDRTLRIRENHVVAMNGDIALGVRRLRAQVPEGARIEVACRSLDQVRRALDAGADVLVLEHLPITDVRESVTLAAGRAAVEVEGALGIDMVRACARAGVQRIAATELASQAGTLDLTLEFEAMG